MKRFLFLFSMVLISVGFTSCPKKQTVNVVAPLSPQVGQVFDRSTELKKLQDQQNETYAAKESKVGASLEAIKYSTTFAGPTQVQNALNLEEDLAIQTESAKIADADRTAAMARVNASLKNQLDVSTKLYDDARKTITDQQKILQDQQKAIDAKEVERVQAVQAAQLAQQKSADDLKAVLDAKDRAVQQAVDDARSERKAWAVKILAGLGAAAVAFGIFQAILSSFVKWQTGGLTALGGLVLIGVSQLIDMKWFPYAVGGALLLILIGSGLWFWHQHQQVKIAVKTTDSIQDFKDAISEVGSDAFYTKLMQAKAAGKSPWDFVSAYFEYRFRDTPELEDYLSKWLIARGVNSDKTTSALSDKPLPPTNQPIPAVTGPVPPTKDPSASTVIIGTQGTQGVQA